MRTTTLFTRLALLCAGAGLLACAPIGGHATFEAAMPSADDAYFAGRNHHLARRYDEARAAYELALQAAPGHVNARNGLATLYAEQRQFGAAIALWRGLTESLTLASGPGKAYLFSNLGHAYFLSEDYGQALVALEKACLLDPLSPRSWQLLGETLRMLGQEGRAQQMLSQAEALRRHDVRADYAAAGGQTAVAAIDRALKAPVGAEPGWSQVQLHAGADGMLELRRGPAPAGPSAPAPAPAAPGAAPASVLVELRNGNGVTGMARMLARQVGVREWKVMRLSNQPGFGVRHTRIEFEAAYREAAERLAGRFGSVQLQEVASCAPARLRVVLGRDIAQRGFTLKPALPAADAPVLAANNPD
ncbi:LytR C-terminal domain-containing protein [Massilia sp. IC2-476]|uniref:LytR C-terminal domain-containing protein n=1 Tax=Massilia sp. IC2-476 TaxID=2887199 RepID=UPI001D1159E2|nr:LytR C-terminal domain-containing protein [Massilia sp. IC2-476]MCC2974684.1 tetratricopeptide repeat protein [Massilia sp. IC2-476]